MNRKLYAKILLMFILIFQSKRHEMLITFTFLIVLCSSQVLSSDLADRNFKIVGGHPARPNQFPHAVALILHIEAGESFCGGSIIHQHYVLTAAHCLVRIKIAQSFANLDLNVAIVIWAFLQNQDDVSRVDVLAGLNNIFRGSPEYRLAVLPRDIRSHPQYNRETLVNDIGLVFVLTRFPLGTSMQRIALPQRSDMSNRLDGLIGTVIGWGRTSDSE